MRGSGAYPTHTICTMYGTHDDAPPTIRKRTRKIIDWCIQIKNAQALHQFWIAAKLADEARRADEQHQGASR